MRKLLLGPYARIESARTLSEKEALDFLLGFEWDRPWKRNYLATQVNRYAVTLDHLSRLPKETRTLEVGALPFGFTLLLRHVLFDHVQASDFSRSQAAHAALQIGKEIFVSRAGKVSYEIDVSYFNMEKDIWPYNDESFDLVIAAEVIEHMTQDPMHIISEANRVLRKGGSLFISTPNLLSLWKLNRMFDGLQPIGDPFYRLDSVYNRHNRELTPEEVEVLYTSGGFAVEYIHTLNVKRKNIANPLRFLLIRLLAGSIHNRKDIIFAMGTKKGSVRERYPTACQLYK
jgi:SAM-dependent methyltransferase